MEKELLERMRFTQARMNNELEINKMLTMRKTSKKPVFEVIEYNGVKLKGKRISGKYYTLNDEEKKAIADGKEKSDKLSAKYVINFGKYKGIKMCDMVSEEQYKYCVWYYNTLKTELSTSAKKKSREYKSFSWRVRNNKVVNN